VAKGEVIIRSAQFLMSNTDVKKCPDANLPEYAFIGRSNVGKSSLINMLTNHKKLAKISTKPGKTQLINHFLINNEWYLVDLPGYGYAKTSKQLRTTWAGFIKKYLMQRENLVCIFVLIDSRHEAQKIDLDFMYNLAANQLPFAMVFTKADKLGKNKLSQNLQAYFKTMTETWEIPPTHFVTSSSTKQGRIELLEYIEDLNNSEVAKHIKSKIY
jgi:GTP-binding protein